MVVFTTDTDHEIGRAEIFTDSTGEQTIDAILPPPPPRGPRPRGRGHGGDDGGVPRWMPGAVYFAGVFLGWAALLMIEAMRRERR